HVPANLGGLISLDQRQYALWRMGDRKIVDKAPDPDADRRRGAAERRNAAVHFAILLARQLKTEQRIVEQIAAMFEHLRDVLALDEIFGIHDSARVQALAFQYLPWIAASFAGEIGKALQVRGPTLQFRRRRIERPVKGEEKFVSHWGGRLSVHSSPARP